MRLTTFILIIALAQVSAKSFSQISLNERNTPIVDVLKNIEKQSGFVFLYDYKELKDAKVSVTIKNASITEALDASLKSVHLTYVLGDTKTITIKPRPFTLLDKLSSVISNIVRDLTVKGRVLDQDGKPLPNASIRVKGKNTVINTNQNGEFEIKDVADDAVLLISYVGYKTLEIPVKGAVMPLEIKLNGLTGELDEVNVISTGYQQLSKERVTGSFTLIDNKTLNQQVGTNILKRLEGVTNGLQFINKQDRNRKLGMAIRGFSTINGLLDPLIVLDGFIYEGNIENINPNDIENITVLKDAAAASIWGARAGNGVIVLTTIKGKLNQKLQIAASANVMVSDKPDLYAVPQLSSAGYIAVEEFLFQKGYFNSAIATPNTGLTPAVEVFNRRKLNQISKADSARLIQELTGIDSRKEYLKYFYTHALTQQYAANIRGGSATNAYTFAAGYDSNLGQTYERSDKLNIRLNNIYQPFKNLSISTGLYYTNTKSSSGRLAAFQGVAINSRIVPYLKFADENGNALAINSKYRGTYTDTAGAGKLLDWKYRPLDEYKYTDNNSVLQEYNVNIGLQCRFWKGFNFEASYQYQKQQVESNNLSDVNSFAARDYINTFSQLNRATGVVKYNVPVGGIMRMGTASVKSYTLRGQLNYNGSWGIHELNGILGAETREAVNTGNSSTLYGYKADPLSYGAVDFVTTFPTFVTGAGRTIEGIPVLTDMNNRAVSLYTNLAYTLMGRYTASLSARKDGSNIFGVNTNDKWKPLWSAGLAWKLYKEDFFNLSWMPYLNLRATYGYSGNVDISRSALAVASYSTNSTSNLPYARVSVLNNPELRWEQVAMFNTGIDFSLKCGGLKGSVEYYRKKGTDLYGPAPFDYTAGGSNTITKNVANIQGQGVEISLSATPINHTFKWSPSLIFNYSDTKVSAYFSTESQQLSTLLGAGNVISPVVGKSVYSIAAYKWGGLDASGRPQGYLDGKLSIDYPRINNEAIAKGADGNIVYMGSAAPLYTGSFINSFSFKQFTLAFNLNYKFDYYFRRPRLSYTTMVAGAPGHPDYAKRWQKPGDEMTTSVPAFIYPLVSQSDGFYGNSEINVLKADHVRLQYVSLSYVLDKNRVKNLPFHDLRLSLNLSNCGIIWRANKEGLDPDYAGAIPPAKVYAVGFTVNF